MGRKGQNEDSRGGGKRRTKEAWTFREKGREVESNEDHEQATFRRDQMFVGLYCFRNNTNININKISVSLLACGMHNIPWYKLAKKANTVGYNCTLEPETFFVCWCCVAVGPRRRT